MRYDNDYIDGLLSLSVHIFKEVYMWSCDRIYVKHIWEGKGCVRFLG